MAADEAIRWAASIALILKVDPLTVLAASVEDAILYASLAIAAASIRKASST